MSKPLITIIKRGPCVTSAVKVLITQGGNKIELDDHAKLCRCGESLDKPFCDGLHEILEFEDEKDPYRAPDNVDVYEGKNITIYFDTGICSHRGICYEELPSVWLEHDVKPDGAPIEEIIDICKRCPSGALSYQLPNKERCQTGLEVQPQISLAPKRYGFDGPLEVAGGVELVDPEGNKPATMDHYALCRCGKSKNLPFCSGEHWAVKFEDENNDE